MKQKTTDRTTAKQEDEHTTTKRERGVEEVEDAKTVADAMEAELQLLIRFGLQERAALFEKDPEHMKKLTEVFTRDALNEAKRLLGDSWVVIGYREEWDAMETCLCNRIQSKRFRRKLKHRQRYADVESMQCVRILDLIIRALRADQTAEKGQSPECSTADG